MKLASEAIISAACESWLKRAYIFRFPNVVGSPATHGILFDFRRKIKQNPKLLDVLGNGSQKKIYLHVDDLINAMLHVVENNQSQNVQLYNIGPDDDGVDVGWIVSEFLKIYNSDASVNYGKINKGWVGDVPSYKYSIEKIKATGWSPSMTSQEAVRRAIIDNIDTV
jgi:UDP-glucose 4-epimerase